MSTLAELNGVEWMQDGTFTGADGRAVRCYDDVVLSRSVPVSGGVRTDVQEVPAGTVGTVLFIGRGDPELADLELYVGADGFTFGREETRFLTLHMTNEEKHPR